MIAADVISLYTELENLRITIWIDGGWGVDALLGEQTRLHQDLDITIQQKDVLKLRQLLQERGLSECVWQLFHSENVLSVIDAFKQTLIRLNWSNLCLWRPILNLATTRGH